MADPVHNHTVLHIPRSEAMSSVLVDVEGDSPEIEVAAESTSGMQLLTGHNSYIASMAKLCKESECFTDVRIVCADGDIRAHRFDQLMS